MSLPLRFVSCRAGHCLPGLYWPRWLSLPKPKSVSVVPVPGKVECDGKYGDWDLSGGILICGDVENSARQARRVDARDVRRGQRLLARSLAR